MTTPVDDLIVHDHTGCVCGPALVPVVSGTGQRGDIAIHRRLDEGLTELREELLSAVQAGQAD